MFAYGRNLYKIWSGNRVVAFVTAAGFEAAGKAYRDNGGKAENIEVEQISFGYPKDSIAIYA
jgi:hypothetical protein